jgi:hypothetical protein
MFSSVVRAGEQMCGLRSGRTTERLKDLGSAFLGYWQIELRRHSHEVRHRVGFHLPHHLTTVALDGWFTRSEFPADLLVE